MLRRSLGVALVLAGGNALAQPAALQELAWLAGCWAHTGSEPGSVEIWTAPAGNTMLGLSRTVRKGKTVEWEHMVIREVAPGKLAYVAKPSRQAEASFPLVRLSDGEAVFENPGHDFPQRITYRRDSADIVVAGIDGTLPGGRSKAVLFPLQRTACPGN